MTCLGLVLSLLGAQTRMRNLADVPVQKMLGMGSEGWGAITLAYSMFVFERHCFLPLREAYHIKGIDASFWIGPGFYAFIVCIFANLLRMLVHILTPMPGLGEGLFPLVNFFMCKSIKRDKLKQAPIEETRTPKSRPGPEEGEVEKIEQVEMTTSYALVAATEEAAMESGERVAPIDARI